MSATAAVASALNEHEMLMGPVDTLEMDGRLVYRLMAEAVADRRAAYLPPSLFGPGQTTVRFIDYDVEVNNELPMNVVAFLVGGEVRGHADIPEEEAA